MRKIASISIVVLFISVLCVGIAAAETINMLCDSRHEFTVVRKLLPEFTAKTGITVNFIQEQETPLRAKTALELSAPSTEIDVIMLDFMFLPLYAEKGYLAPLDEYLESIPSFNKDDYMKPFLDAATYNGKLYGLPNCQDCNLLMYRADLFQKYGLDVPSTFDELWDVAAKLTGVEPGLYGIALRGQRGYGVNEWTWPTFLRGFGGRYYDENFYPTLNSPEAIKALAYYVELIKNFGPPGVASYSYIEVQKDLMESRVAMILDSATLGVRAEKPELSKVAGKLGYAIVPGNVERQPGFYSWLFVVPAKSHRKKSAVEFIAWMLAPENAKKIGWSAPNQALETVYNIPPYAEYPQSEPLLKVMKESLALADPEYRPRIPEEKEVGTAISIAISEAIAGSKTPREALEIANKEAYQILKKAGYYK